MKSMLEACNSTLPYRIAGALLFFGLLGVRDWMRNPTNPTRVKEYGFLVVSMLLSVVYGILHDHLTATISVEYFLNAKGLGTDPRPYRWAVTLLAIKASYGPGVLAGALILIANNPSNRKPQLPYRHLFRFCAYPVLGAATCAAILGAAMPLIARGTWIVDAALAFAPAESVGRFLTVWGIHAGSYGGATLGTVIAVISVVAARNSLASRPSLPCDDRSSMLPV